MANAQTDESKLSDYLVEVCKSDIRDIAGFDRTEFVSVEKGRFVMRAHPGPDCANEFGNVHGGFLLALADEAAAGATDTYGRENVTMTVSANFLRPAHTSDEYLEVTGTALHAGRRTAAVEVVIVRPGGEVAMKATYTMAMFDERTGEGRAGKRV